MKLYVTLVLGTTSSLAIASAYHGVFSTPNDAKGFAVSSFIEDNKNAVVNKISTTLVNDDIVELAYKNIVK